MKKKSAFNNGKMTCDYCGKVRDQIIFCIGASKKADWVLHQGSGKVSCPECWEIGRKEGEEIIDKHIAYVNRRKAV